MTRAGSSPHSERFSLRDDDVEGDIPLAPVDVIGLLKCVSQPDEDRSGATRATTESERRVVVAGAVAESSALVIEGHERHQHDVEALDRDTAGRRDGLVYAESTGDEAVVAAPAGKGHGARRLSDREIDAPSRLPGPLHDRIAVDLAAYGPIGRDAHGTGELGQIGDATAYGSTRTSDIGHVEPGSLGEECSA